MTICGQKPTKTRFELTKCQLLFNLCHIIMLKYRNYMIFSEKNYIYLGEVSYKSCKNSKLYDFFFRAHLALRASRVFRGSVTLGVLTHFVRCGRWLSPPLHTLAPLDYLQKLRALLLYHFLHSSRILSPLSTSSPRTSWIFSNFILECIVSITRSKSFLPYF